MVYRKVARLSGVLFLLATVSQSNHVATEFPIQEPFTSPSELENNEDLLALSTRFENSVHDVGKHSESPSNLPLPESDIKPTDHLVGQLHQQSNFDEPVLPHPNLPPNTETPSLLQLVEKSRKPPPPSEISGTFYMLHMVPPDLDGSPKPQEEVSHSGLHQSLDGSHEHSGEVTGHEMHSEGISKHNSEAQHLVHHEVSNYNPEEANAFNQNVGVVSEVSHLDVNMQKVKPVENHQESHRLGVEIPDSTVFNDTLSFQNMVHTTSHEPSENIQVAAAVDNFGETDLNIQTFSSENSHTAFVADPLLPVIDTLYSNQDISSGKEVDEAKKFVNTLNIENNIDGSKIQDDPFVDEVNAAHNLTNPSGSSSQVYHQVIPRTKSDQTDLSHLSSVEHTLYAEASPDISEVPRGINVLPVAEKDSFIPNDVHPQQYQHSGQSSEEQHQPIPNQEYQSPASSVIPITSDTSYQRDDQPVISESFDAAYQQDAELAIAEISGNAYQPVQPVFTDSSDIAYQPEDQTVIPQVSDNSYQPADQADLNSGSSHATDSNRRPKTAGGGGGGGGIKPLFSPPVSGEGKGALQPGPEEKESLMPYQFSYNVSDPSKGAEYGHTEDSDGNVVKGQYFVVLPDGRRQTVQYQADHVNGYQSEVEYQNGIVSGGANVLNQQIFNGGKAGNQPNNLLPSGPLISAGNQYSQPTINGNNNNDQGSYNRQQFTDNGAVAGNIQVSQQQGQSSSGGENVYQSSISSQLQPENEGKHQFQQGPSDNGQLQTFDDGSQYQFQSSQDQPNPSGESFHQNPVNNGEQYQAAPENNPFPSINEGNQYQPNSGNIHDVFNTDAQFPANNDGQFPANNGGQSYQPLDSNNQHQPPTENHLPQPNIGNHYDPSNNGAQLPPVHGNSQSPPDAEGQYQIANDVGQFPPVYVGNQDQPVNNGDHFQQVGEYQPQSFDKPGFQPTFGNDVFQPADGNNQYQSLNDGNSFQPNDHQSQPINGDEYQFSGANNPQSHYQEGFIQVLGNNDDQFQPQNDGNQFQNLDNNQYQSYSGNEEFPPIGNQFEPNSGIPISASGDGNQFHQSSGNNQHRQEPPGNPLPFLGDDQYHNNIPSDYSSENQVLGPGHFADGGNVENGIANDFSGENQAFPGPGQYENSGNNEPFQAFSENDQYLLQNVDVRIRNEGHQALGGTFGPESQAFSGEQVESFDNQGHGFQEFQEFSGSPEGGSFEVINNNDNYQRPIHEPLGISQGNPPQHNSNPGQFFAENIQQAQLSRNPSGPSIEHSDPQHKNCADEFRPIEGSHSQ